MLVQYVPKRIDRRYGPASGATKPQKTFQSTWQPGRVVVREAFKRFPHGGGTGAKEEQGCVSGDV